MEKRLTAVSVFVAEIIETGDEEGTTQQISQRHRQQIAKQKTAGSPAQMSNPGNPRHQIDQQIDRHHAHNCIPASRHLQGPSWP